MATVPALVHDVRRAADRFVSQGPGITSRHSFSFGAHYDPGNVGFGALVAYNEEWIGVGAGFPEHPHAATEIVTWVLSGALAHEDTTGHRGVVAPGVAQRMSAGAGVRHSERNAAMALGGDPPADPVHVLQMWLRPDASTAAPSYAARPFDLADLAAQWLPIASGRHPDAVVTLDSAGSTLWATRIAAGALRRLPAASGRTHVYVAAGEVVADRKSVV